jgi:hypothetical protein
VAPPRPRRSARQVHGQAQGANPLPWAQKYEKAIRVGLSVVYVADASDALWIAWQLKGKPEAVIASVDQWLKAAEKIDESEQAMAASRDDLKGLWSGPAFEAFSGYMDRNIGAATQNRDALIAAAGHLVDMYIQVITAYNEALNQVIQAGIRIDSLVGLWVGNENQQQKEGIRQALITLATNVITRENTLRSTLGGYRASLARVKAEQVRLKQPNDIPPAARDRDRWDRVG